MKNQSSKFYNGFADKYDLMISDKRYNAEIPFFEKIFKEYKVKSILDCACGTGWHAIKFQELGFEATGCDISKDMITKAKSNSSSVDFFQADFKKLDKSIDKNFDCVICWGNSLSHELEEKDILSALKNMYNALNDKGIVVVQIRNLPILIKENKRIFPMHFHKEPNGDVKLFIYVLDFCKTKTTYNVISVIESDGVPKFEVNSSDYRIVSCDELKSLMIKAGFKNLKAYGDFQFTKFNKNSDDIIIIGSR